MKAPTVRSEPTVHIVDDNAAVRDAVRWLVEEVGLRAATYASGNEFLNDLSPQMAGCIVLDIRMPGLSGLDVQQRMLEMGSDLPIIIITGHGDVPVAVRAMKAGAFEFLQKPFGDQQLLDCVSAALARHAERRAERSRHDFTDQALASLTARERAVLRLLRAGNSSKLIADALGISVRTVEGHRAHLMAKLGVRTLPQLVDRLLPPALEL